MTPATLISPRTFLVSIIAMATAFPVTGAESLRGKTTSTRSPPGAQARITDLFAPPKWGVSPAPTRISGPPPQAIAPQAPPLPFRLFGQLHEAGLEPTFYLSKGKDIIAVRIGERIDPNYLLEKFDGTLLHLVYLPLKARQTLFVGNIND